LEVEETIGEIACDAGVVTLMASGDFVMPV